MSADILALAASTLPTHMGLPFFAPKETIEAMNFVLGRDVLSQDVIPATVATAGGAQVNWWHLNMNPVELLPPMLAAALLYEMTRYGLPQQFIDKAGEVLRPVKPTGLYHAFITTLDGDGNPTMCDHGMATKHLRHAGEHIFRTVEVGNIGLPILPLAFDPQSSANHAQRRGHQESSLSTTVFDAHTDAKEAGEVLALYHKGVDRLRAWYAAPLKTVRNQMELFFPREFVQFLPDWAIQALGAAATHHLVRNHPLNSNAQAHDKAAILGIPMPHQCTEATAPGVSESFFPLLADRDKEHASLWKSMADRRKDLELTSLNARAASAAAADALALA